MTDGRRTDTIAADYFDDLYRRDADPWRFGSSAYEAEKYKDTLALLSRDHYGAVLEVGCSIGVFTRMLAARSESVLAVDASDVALAAARSACADLPAVTLASCMVPTGFPDGRFDLIVLSEVLYYLTAADVARTASLCQEHLRPGGEMMLCHWLGETDYPLTGDEAAETFREALSSGFVHEARHRPQYRLDRLTRTAA